jgi:hypothetical protein
VSQVPYANTMWRIIFSQHPLTAALYRRLQGRPPWIIKSAVLTALLVLVIPLVALVLTALIVGVTVFAVLMLAARANAWLRALVDRLLHGPADDGRRNVRVVERNG